MPIRDKVYNKLKSLGLTDSKEDFFNYYDSDESVRKDVYQRLKEDGLRNTEDEFYAAMNPQKDIQKSEDDTVFEANAERLRNGQPIERVTTQSVIDANPALGSQQPVITPYSIDRASLKEQVASNSRKFPKMGDLPWAKPQGGTDGYVHTTDLSERLNRTYQDGGMESFLHSEEDEKIKAQYTPKEEKTTADVWGNAMNKFALTERGGQLQSELAQIQDEITNKYLEEFKDSDEYKQFLGKKYATKDEEYKANKAVNDLFNAKYAEAISNDMQPYMQAYNNEVMHRYGVDVESGLNNIAKKEAAETLWNLSTSVNADLEKIEDAITSRQKAVRNTDWKPGMPSSRDDAKLSELRGQRTYLEGAKELIEDSQNILNAVEAEKDGSFFGGLGRGIRDKAFDIDTWTMGLSDLVGGLRLKSVLEKAEKGENLTPAEEKLLDASVNNMAVNFYYRNDLGLGYQAGEITGQSIPFMLEFLVNPVSASGNAMAKRLLTYGLKRFGSAVNSKAIKAGTRLATDALAAGGVTATTGMGHVLSGGVERLNRNYEYGLDEEGNLNVVNTHNMSVGEAFAKSATSAFLERQSEMIFNAFRGAPSLFKGIETSLPGGVNTFMNYVSNSRLGELWRGIKNNATMNELAKRTQFHGLGEEYLEEVYNNFANIPLGEMTFEEATDLENNIVTFLGLAPTQVMFSAIGGIGYGVERYKARRDLERTFGKMTEEQKRKLMELQEMGKLSTNKDIAFFLAETIKDESLTPEQKRAEIEYAYNLAKQNAIDEVSNTDVEDSIESENQQIDAATDPQTGMYGEVNLVGKDLDGNDIVSTANVFGEKEVNGELYLLVLPEGEAEKKWVRPNQYDANSYQKRPAEEVKELNEEMIREEAAKQSEQEAKYAPEVINAQMQQGVPFDTPNAQIVPVAPMPEGNGWIVEEYALDTNNKVAKTPIVRELTNDEYRDMLQAQLNAEEAAQKQLEEQATAQEVVEEVQPTEEADVKENFTTETGNNLSPVEEVAQPQAEVKPQTPVIPTKEDGSIDFVSYGKEGTFKTLGEKYGEKMPNKVSVTVKAFADDLAKAQKKLDKAIEDYDNAPIGREEKAEKARDKAQQELDAIKREADFWAEMDAEIKDAQFRRASILNPQAEVETSTEPMNADEFVAQQLASGNIVLNKEDYKSETGYGDAEANALNGGAAKLFGENGMTIQEAGERLMEIDRENGTNFFDQNDSNAGRDALISLLGSVKSRKELNQYIATNRAEQAKRESEGLRNELEKQAMEANYASLEDYVLQMEAAEMENPFLNDRADEIMAIFAEEAAKYEQSLNNTENGQGTENEVVEGNDSILLEEQLDNTGGTEVSEESERIGDGTSEESESAHAATEVELKQEEGETTLQFAERAAEENRRRPLRKRAEEWSNTLGIKVTYLESIDDVDADTRREIEAAHAKGKSVPGWVNKKGEVFFFMPDLSDLKDVDDTYIHEVVAHVGLPQLLGKERFGELCDKVWEMMPQSAKDYYMSYPGVKNHRDAADEYIAHLAEQQNLTPEEKTIWDNIVKMFREMLDKALNGIISKSKLTDEDISNLIKASYANLKSGAEGVSGEGTRFSVIERANEEFNKQLDEFKNKTHRGLLSLGAPQDILRKIGVNVNEITISPTILHRHLKKHHLDIEDLKGLASAIQNPILSYKHGKRFPNLVIVTEMNVKGGKLSVSLELDESGSVVEISNVKSVHSKEALTELQRLSELSEEEFKSSLKWVEKEKVSEWLLRLPYEDERTIDNQKLNSIANIINSFENPKTIEEKSPSFRVIEDKNGRKSLVGLHNISEDKLRKAIKQGGLANPSMAVIDMDKQSHVDYGDITLVAPESLVDKKLGKNVGTYMADAYTPVYPTVVKKLSDKGGKALTKALESVDETFRSKVRTYFNSYLDTGTHYDALAYWYLSDTGKNPPILEAALPEGFTKEEIEKVKSINPEVDSFFQLSEDEKQKALTLYADKFFKGFKEYKEHLADYTKRMQEVVQNESKPQFVRKNIQQNLNAIERYGYEYDRVAGYYNRAVFLASRQSKPSEFETFRNAFDEVSKNGLEEDFGNWLMAKEAELGVEEMLFAGYDNQGRAKYKPNTLENASKLMKKEGRAGATGLGGFNYFVAILAPVAKTTKEINKKKGNLSTQEEYDAFAKKWSEYYHDLALQLQPGADKWADYGYHRLHEIAPMSNPKDYVKREYGIELSDKFIKDLNEVKTAIKNDFPARYFETKFERPVYLNEFAAAVVPQGTSKDVVDALTKVGLPIEEYESGNNEARMAAIDKVSSEMGGIRFRFIGERGARNLDKTEEATTRLDNLAVAREMETAEKDAKTIKMATGWERGADGLWRYEVDDNLKFDLSANVDYRKRHPEFARFEDLRHKYNANLLEIGEPLTEEEQKEYESLVNEFGGSTELHRSRKLKDYVDAPELFEAYPELRNIDLSFAEMDEDTEGKYLPKSKSIQLNENIMYTGQRVIGRVLVHEIQHAIQDIEGFEPGANKDMQNPNKLAQKQQNIEFMQNQLDKHVSERNELLEQKDELNAKMSDWYDSHEEATAEDVANDKDMSEWNRLYDELESKIEDADRKVSWDKKWLDTINKANTQLGIEGYAKVSGEVEARNVMSRLGMTLEQRRNSLASETEDVAREDQIFLKDGIESGMRFRLSEKGKQIQAEVDKFTSKYNSKPVRIVEAEMDDNELMEALDNAFELEDVKSFMAKSKTAAGYFHNLDKIIIFADKTKVERMEEYLFHENIHAAIHHNNFANLVAHFYEYAKNEAVFEKWSKLAHNKEYKQYNSSEEFLAYVVSNAMVARNLDEVAEYLGDKQKKALNKLFNVIGYDYDIRRRSDEQSVNGRTSEETSGESSLEGNELLNTGEGRGTGEGIGKGKSGKVSAAERKARLNELFNKVADMGLQGVLGNKEYTSLMVDIYKALPEEVRAEIAEDALRLYGGSVAPAVSDYIGPKSKNSIMDKVVTIVREALRKVGFDIDLNGNEVRYLAWRSKKPLDRNSLLEMAEDIDMRFRLKVGEYDGTTPDGGSTRFRRVYHGSGASFDKFDHSFMGTGEGAQAYGWGTYVTEVGGIARSYATTMASKSGVDPLSYVGEYENYVGKDVVNIAKEYIRRNSFDLKKAKEEVEHDLKLTMPALSRKGAEFLLSTTEEDWTYNPNRHLYEVEIPDDNGRNYLYWEKQYTRDELEDIASRSNGSVSVDDIDPKGVTKDGLTIKGGKIVRAMSEARGPRMPMAKEASRKLSLCGFVGIEFPAEYRTGGREDNAKNYVIFNEKDLEIKEHTRFRVANKLQVRDEYEATIKKGGYQAREAVQDAMLSLRKFQELIEKATGKKIRDFENAWMHENRLSSVVQAEIHDMERKFYKPMMDAVKKLMSVANLEQEQVADYLMLKHGIERNREMAVRKALTDDKGKIDRTRLEQWYKEKDAIRNDATLDTWRKKQEAMDNAALNYGADMSRDYSGLTSMFGTDDLADSTQKAYDEVEALENAHPVETESLGKAIKAMTQNTLDKSFESGLMDRKVYDELSKDMYDYYIPLRGFEETTSEEVYAYLDQDRGAFNAPLKRAKGRSSKSDNPIAYLKSIAESGIMQGNRNKMKQSFLNMVINHPSDLVSVREGVWVIYNPATGEWEAASAPAIPNNAIPADVEAAMEAWEQQMEQAAQNDPNIKKVSEAADVPYRVVGNRMDQHQVIVKRLGKSYTLTINGNPRLAMAINGQTNPNNTSNDGKVAAFVNNKIGALNRSLAAWYTTRNPDFVASNFMRDTFYTNTIVRAKEGNAYANKFHKNYATVLPKMLGLFRKYENGTLDPADQTEAAFIDFMMNGGETGYSNLKDLEEIKKQITKALKESKWDKAVTAVGLKALRRENVEALAEKLDILNRAVENTARFAAYLTSREEGRSVAKSIFDAKEISVNFNKKGAGGTFFGMTGQTWFGNLAAMVGASGRALYVFFNAAIQGSTNLMHVMKVNPKGTSAGLAAMFLMGAVIPFLFDDDDEKDYYDLPEHVRRNHLIIPGTGDAWISIPLPIEYRIMYGMGELLTSWRTGHERGSDIARKMLGMSGQALPLNFLEEGLEAFVPSAVSPIYQVMTNSSWTGLPIYKENDFNKDDPEYTKAYSNVDRNLLKFTKALYEWSFDEENQKERIDLNPAIIETLAKGYFGGLATQLSNLAKVGGMIAGEQEFDWRNIPIGNRILKTGDERTKEKRVTNEYFENMEKLDFLQSRERMLKKAEKGVAVPEADKFKAQKDLETMQGTEVYKKYQEFKKQKKVVDKIRKTIKEKGSTPEREKQLMEAQEAANKSVR